MCSKGSVTAVLEPIKCINCINLEFYWGFRQIVEPQTVFSRMSRATRDQAARPGSVLMEINGYNSGLNCKTPHTLHQGVVGFFNLDSDTIQLLSAKADLYILMLFVSTYVTLVQNLTN